MQQSINSTIAAVASKKFMQKTSKSLTDLKHKIQKAMKVQKEENNQIGQLSQQLEEAQQQL